MPTVLLRPRGVRMCRQESAEAIVAPSTGGEGPNFMLRTGAFTVREAGVVEVRAAMYEADAEDAGRNLAVAA